MRASSEASIGRRHTGSAAARVVVSRPALAAPELRGPFECARHALAEWLSHLIVVVGLLLGLHSIEAAFRILFTDPPLTSLFDAGDTGLIIGFLAYGVYSVLNAYGAEPVTQPEDTGTDGAHGRIERRVRFALRSAPASFTIGSFVERLAGHLLIYTVILVGSIYLWLFTLAPLPVTIGSMVVLLLIAIASAAVSLPRGSLSVKLSWLVDNRMTAGSFVVAFAVLLLVEEILRRSS